MYWGWSPRGAAPAPRPTAAPTVPAAAAAAAAAAQGKIYQVQRPVPLPAAVIGVPAPPWGDASEAELRVLSLVMEARLRHYLIETPRPLAALVDVDLLRMESGGLLAVKAVLARDVTHQQLEEAVFSQPRLIYNEVTQRELNAAAAHEVLRTLITRESASGVAGDIAEAVTYGAPDRADRELADMTRLNINQLGQLALQTFNASRATTLRVLPAGDPATQAVAANRAAQRMATAPVFAADLQEDDAAHATFPPGYPTDPPISTTPQPAPQRRESAREIGGAKVIVDSDPASRVVHWAIAIPCGWGNDPPGKEGLAEVVAAMVQRQKRHSFFDPRKPRDLDLRAVSVDMSVAAAYTVLTGTTVPERLNDGIEQTRRILCEPELTDRDFAEPALAAAKLKVMADATRRAADAGQAALGELSSMVTGHRPRLATTRSAAGITLEDVRAFYRAAYRRNGALFVLAGDVSPEQGDAAAREILADWQPGGVTNPAPADVPGPRRPATRRAPSTAAHPAQGDLEITVIDRPNAARCSIRFAGPAYDASSPDRFAGELVGHVLARGVHSRLGRFVRAENGYAYTVTGGFAPYRDAGFFLAAADTEPETTGATVSGMLSVLRDMGEHEITPDELAEAKAYVAGAQVVLDETPLRRLNRRLRRELSGWEDAAGDSAGDTNPAATTDAAAMAAVTAADVRRVTQKYIDPAKLKIVVVGPADAVAEPLRDLAPLVRVVRGGATDR
jgi:zinc protease